MTTPYWGQLPPPKITRGNSLKNPDNSNRSNLPYNLTIDADTGGRAPAQPQYPVQSQQPRQNRYSNQTTHTDATISTRSPFASPVALSFRGDGLAPRPPSSGYGTTEGGYNNDYLEKRRRRESRNREFCDSPTPAHPPAAPDAPKPPPPVSYKHSYNGQNARSTQRSTGPVGSRDNPEDYYRSGQRGQYPADESQAARRSSKGKAVERHGEPEWDRSKPERLDTLQSRKGSLSEAEEKRRREWAPDRSPLQRLELTLDSITKEEKRARVEEAELLVREAKAGRGGDRSGSNSVRFRNRPVAKAPSETISQPEPQSLPEAGLVRNLSNRQRDQLQRSGTVEKKRPTQPELSPANPSGGFEYQAEVLPDPQKPKDVPNQRKPSIRERSAIPIATGVAGAVGATAVGRSGSNKLRKEPPIDPWVKSRADGEKMFQDVAPRRPSADIRQQENISVVGPSRGTAFGSHPQTGRDKELPSAPNTGGLGPQYPIDPESNDDDLDERPIRRGSSRKIEQLTGHKAEAQAPRSIPPAQQQPYADRLGHPELEPSGTRQPGKEVRTELVTVNGIKYAISPVVAASTSNGPWDELQNHSHLSRLLHHGREENGSGPGVYIPPRRLDEWKRGGVALLAGELLGLDVPEQTDAEKDKAWWEAGHTGKRRRSSTKHRKAEAYDGEYDDNNGIVPQISELAQKPEKEDECEGCVPEWNQPGSSPDRCSKAYFSDPTQREACKKKGKKDGHHEQRSQPPKVPFLQHLVPKGHLQCHQLFYLIPGCLL